MEHIQSWKQRELFVAYNTIFSLFFSILFLFFILLAQFHRRSEIYLWSTVSQTRQRWWSDGIHPVTTRVRSPDTRYKYLSLMKTCVPRDSRISGESYTTRSNLATISETCTPTPFTKSAFRLRHKLDEGIPEPSLCEPRGHVSRGGDGLVAELYDSVIRNIQSLDERR